MPEVMRAIAARLREFVGNRRRAPRYRARLLFSVSLLDKATADKSSPPQKRRAPAVEGYTRDLSATGLALIVPAIRVGDRYLSGEGNILSIKLELPAGPVQIQAAPVRYEQLGEDSEEKGFLIGTHITEMSESDRTRYTEYLLEFKRR